ncbi:uncharacterized protein LOC134194206 [Corticium candelabrum]|uniref:uncharacterized protein LOC134194206 n=1 Tax=Corticium candelabrum TaxID=121492 RepID=UPI002E25D716|nr:uncharacterized protein LOC134194206 [Corticium candelabrum]
MPQQSSRRAMVCCRIGARIVNTALACAVVGLIASRLYTTGKCYTLRFAFPCHWVFVTSSLSILVAVGYCAVDCMRFSGEKPHRTNDFEGFFLKTGVLVSVALTGIWLTSGCLLSKQLADFQRKNDELQGEERANVGYVTVLFGIITIVASLVTAISWLALAVYEGIDLRHWLREKQLQKYRWSRLIEPDEEYEQAEALCEPTSLGNGRRQKGW